MLHCRYCNCQCNKAGLQKNKVQRYRCKKCKKFQQACYNYTACALDNKIITIYNNEGIGIRGLARLLKISPTTVIRRIRKIGSSLKAPFIFKPGLVYEMDEMRVFIGSKKRVVWIIYVIERSTRKIIDFRVGNRSMYKLKQVIQSVLPRRPKRIYTDRLNLYASLIPKGVHRTTAYGTNTIERCNLTLRTHLKRLNRRTICFSRKLDMLEACLKIYFWG